MRKGLNLNNFLEDITIDEANSNSTSSSYLFVSLYLVILAFFILLNSISTLKKDLSEDITEGVRDAFSDASSSLAGNKNLPDMSISDDAMMASYSSKLGAKLTDYLSISENQIKRVGRNLEVTLYYQELFDKNSAQIHNYEFINKLSQELNRLRNFIRIDIEFILGIKNSEVEGIAQAKNFAKQLINNGVNNDSIFIGISHELPPEKLQINFQLRNLINIETNNAAN